MKLSELFEKKIKDSNSLKDILNLVLNHPEMFEELKSIVKLSLTGMILGIHTKTEEAIFNI